MHAAPTAAPIYKIDNSLVDNPLLFTFINWVWLNGNEGKGAIYNLRELPDYTAYFKNGDLVWNNPRQGIKYSTITKQEFAPYKVGNLPGVKQNMRACG